jgi:hypothetical protein
LKFSIFKEDASFPATDSDDKISRKYWDHPRNKIILGPFAYLKFPRFHSLVKPSSNSHHSDDNPIFFARFPAVD